MADLFLYGTLRHLPLLDIVLGRPAGSLDVVPGILPDHAVFWVQGQSFPIIAARPGQSAPGLLLRGLSPEDVARLDFYEGGFGYDLRPVTIALQAGDSVEAQVYFPRPGVWETGTPWDLDGWAADWAPVVCRAASEMMAYFGRVDGDEIARRYPPMLIRAAAWVAAQARPADPGRDVARDVVVRDFRHAHLNFYGMDEADLQFRRHDGGMSPVLNRCALMVGQAAVVLPYDPRRDAVLLVEQFRAPVFFSGDRAPWVWEPVAGLVDPGETPEQTAHRETAEEAGLGLDRLEKVGSVYSSTGSSGEFVHLYVGLADLADTTENGGLSSEGEDIRSRIVPYETLMEGIDTHRYRDMPLVACALWLARHRDRLREVA